MSTTKKSKKYLVLAVLAVIAIGAFGYVKQDATMKSTSESVANEPKLDLSVLAARPNDIILGDANAMVTIVEYSSLTCPHCAHFHKDVLPELEKEFISTGKAKLVLRHFPLNDAALKAAEVVECAGSQGSQRANFIKVLFEMQDKWAFNETYLADLKRIALVGGVDSASFESCTTDQTLETKILASRQEAGEKLAINSTPSFFINGTKLEGAPTIESLRAAIAAASGE